jgi:hypothetical protein
MSPFQVGLLLIVAASGPVLLIAGVALLVLRFRRGRAPTWLGVLCVVVFGLQSGALAILFIREPMLLASDALAVAVFAWLLVRANRWRTTGVLLIACGLFGVLWWGYFVVQDLVDPADLYQPELWLWWAPSALLILAGAVLATRRDRATEKTIFPIAPTLHRDPMALGTAIVREVSIGSLPIPSLVADGVAVVVVIVGVLWVGHLVPWPVTWIVAAIVYAVIGTELFYFAIPRRLRRAWEGIALVGSPGMKRWRRESGTRVPTSKRAMEAWLHDTPDRPGLRWARAEAQATLGDLDAARASALAMPIDRDSDRFEQRALLFWIEWLGGDDGDLEALATEAETVGLLDSPDRTEARGRVATARARQLTISGGDWKQPLEQLASEHGEAATLLRDDLRRTRYRIELIMGPLVAGAIILFNPFVS